LNETVYAKEQNLNIPVSEYISAENVGIKEKPLMQQMVDAYMMLSNDPENSAYDALYNRLEPSLSEEEKQKQMIRIMQEYKLFKEGKDWKQTQ
jgi:hypothetical protein